jgi:hypothetical protein
MRAVVSERFLIHAWIRIYILTTVQSWYCAVPFVPLRLQITLTWIVVIQPVADHYGSNGV